MYKLARDRIKALRLDIALGSAIKPKWLRKEGNRPPVLKSLLEHLDEATIMAYNDNPKVMDRFARTAFELQKGTGRTIEIAVETGVKGAAPEETWSQEIRKDRGRFFSEMVRLDAIWKKNPCYGGLAIHSYAQYFVLLYGKEAYAYTGSMKNFHAGGSGHSQ
jgi:hypothetical protein